MKKVRMIKKISTTVILVLSLLLTTNVGIFQTRTAFAASTVTSNPLDSGTDVGYFELDSYGEYIESHQDKSRPKQEIIIPAASFTDSKGVEVLNNFEGSPSCIKTGEDGYVEWEVDIKTAGLYNMAVKYYPIEGKSSDIERLLTIDGTIPFDEARNLIMQRVWKDKEKVRQDSRGNDMRPTQVEAPMWQEIVMRDYIVGDYDEPFLFYFPAGKHTLRFTSVREPLVIEYLKIYQEDEVPEYKDVKKRYDQEGYKPASNFLRKIQGEDALYKSDPTLYGTADRSSPTSEPYSASKYKLNTIGGESHWSLPGQCVTWEFEVPEDGLYKIAIKSRQNNPDKRGTFVNRKLMIDGKAPFKEVETIPFFYNADWEMKVLGEEDPYLFYLEKGTHQLSMTITPGDMASIIRTVKDSILELNAVYRKILMITGPTPDQYRDYQFEKKIPEALKTMSEQSQVLFDLVDQLYETTGQKGSNVALLERLAYQLKDIADDPETIKSRLSNFEGNVAALGTWILSAQEQPLEVDYIVVASPDQEFPRAKATFFEKMMHEINAFIASFREDYSVVGEITEGAITVWVPTGRDQLQVIKTMIDDSFTPQTGIAVNLKLVTGGVLLPATVAGKGPDVYLNAGSGDPINYAIRNAVADLTQFPDFPKVAKRFRESAFVPYTLNGKVYALPETQVFPMLFYRKDIMHELGLKVPETWADVYAIIPELQKKYMDFGIPISAQMAGGASDFGDMISYGMFLYQRDGEFYTEDGKASGLDSERAIDAFKEWVKLYTNYKIPLDANFLNRFRTGEMPILISDYSLYNSISVFAPELKGLWAFAPAPGIEMPDGTIRRDIPGRGSNAIMMQASKNKKDAWEFMKWWTSTETQVRFGREMESLMGAAARHPTANIEALELLPWPKADYDNLNKQWEWVRGIPEVPGGYFTGRHLVNAFRSVVYQGEDPRETLLDYVVVINEEITNKRKEFGLEVK